MIRLDHSRRALVFISPRCSSVYNHSGADGQPVDELCCRPRRDVYTPVAGVQTVVVQALAAVKASGVRHRRVVVLVRDKVPAVLGVDAEHAVVCGMHDVVIGLVTAVGGADAQRYLDRFAGRIAQHAHHGWRLAGIHCPTGLAGGTYGCLADVSRQAGYDCFAAQPVPLAATNGDRTAGFIPVGHLPAFQPGFGKRAELTVDMAAVEVGVQIAVQKLL